MKQFLIGLIVTVGGAAFASNGPAFESSFPKFLVQNPEIIWAAKTNYSEKSLWIYKKLSQSYSGTLVSNLMRLGSLTIQDEQKWTGEIEATNTKTLLFVNPSNTCHLLIVPPEGRIEYENDYALAHHWDRTNHLWEQVAGIPSDSKTKKLGLKFLKQFGIQPKDLAQDAKGHLIAFREKQTRGYFDRRRGKYIDEEVMERGIFFNRRIDGINFAGIGIGGGCEIAFGNHAKISRIKLVWPDLQPHEQRQIASPEEIIGYIRDGQAVLTHKNFVNPADVKKLTITDCSPLYMGASGDETQNFVYPFAQVEAIANLGETNVDIQLYCPILLMSSTKP